MKIPKHTERARNVLDRVVGWGFSPEAQRRIGVLGVVWGVFETSIETTLWALQGEDVTGVRPSTDRSTISGWITSFGEGSNRFDEEIQVMLYQASLTATDLMEYRHSLVHGYLVSSPSGPMFVRNPRWSGELRKRQKSDAYVDENLLDMAIDAAWVLCQVVFATRAACMDSSKSRQLLLLRGDLARARSQASELRHLTKLLNHERF